MKDEQDWARYQMEIDQPIATLERARTGPSNAQQIINAELAQVAAFRMS